MEPNHLLMEFGLTHQEARLYTSLYSGPATGYELAKATGISRSNVYAGLSSLVEKGATWRIDGKPIRYQAVPVGEFCGNIIRGLGRAKEKLERQMPLEAGGQEGYITISGEKGIRDKIDNMIAATCSHIYLSMPAAVLEPFLPALGGLLDQGRKVVVITDQPPCLEGAIVYRNSGQPQAIRVISDTDTALTGSATVSCLYSREKNLVSLLRDSMHSEIRLIELEGESK